MKISKHINPRQLKGIIKTGEILIPGDGHFPSFSKTKCITEIDRLLDYMSTDDLSGFKGLMTVFSFLPNSGIRWILNLSEKTDRLPAPLAPPLRLLNLGVKGVIFSMYYSDLTPEGSIRKNLGWDTKCGPNQPYQEIPLLPEVERVFKKAKFAETALRKTTVKERLTYISRLKKLVMERQELIIDEIQKATGKSRSDALMSEIFPVLDHFDYLEKFSEKILGDRKVHTPLTLMGKKSRIYFEPLGTVLVICPWNYPFYQAMVPCTSAFICGNAVVFKPSEVTPLKELLETIFRDADLPDQWIQVVAGDGKVASELIEQRPQKIFFIGSTNTGRKIMAQASKYLIPVELELGGKDPMIVFEDVNLKRAVAGAVWGAFTNTGQSCTSVERLYVQESIYENFRDELIKETKKIVQAIDQDGNADIGVMTTAAQIAIIANHLEDACKKGAKLLTGQEWDRKSKTIPPLVLEGVTSEMKILQEETFGPVLPLLVFRHEEEVIQLANDSDYGLSASVWSKDLARADRVARALVTGNVSINNVMLTEGSHALPFGGVKNSGFGRFKGEFGFYSFSNIKSIIIDGNSSKIEANWYPYTTEKYGLFVKMMRGAFGRGVSALISFAVNGLKLESYASKAAKIGRKP